MNIQHLTCAAGGSTDEIRIKELVNPRNHFGNIAVNIALNIGAVKNITVGISAATMSRHSAFPNALIHFENGRNGGL